MYLDPHNELTIGITDFTVTKARTAVITFSEPLIEYFHSVFIKRPNEGLHFTAFTEPLQNYRDKDIINFNSIPNTSGFNLYTVL